MGKYRDVERLSAENIKLKDQYADLKKDNLCLTQTIRCKDERIYQQEEKIAHDTALMNRSGTNTDISTAVKPINQKKRIPNSRNMQYKSTWLKGLRDNKTYEEIDEAVKKSWCVCHPFLREYGHL